MVLPDLFAKVLAQQRLVEVGLLLEVQRHIALGGRLCGGVPDLTEQAMLQQFADGHARGGVEAQHLVKNVDGVLIRDGEFLSESIAFALREATNVPLGIVALEQLDLCLRGRAQEVEDHVQLVVLPAGMVLVVRLVLVVGGQGEARRSWEERAAVLGLSAVEHAQQLSVDATHRPQVDRLGVILLQQDELRRAVPPRDHVARQEPLQALRVRHHRNAPRLLPAFTTGRVRQFLEMLLLLESDGPRQAEVADFHRAVLVHEAVCRLQIAVVNAGGVKVHQSDEQIVQESADVQLA
mmetsp:Transcript_50849/g.146748  ORF Transcript_50849/g.146748 Transcript_50849/m.146748 type:complete len:294 (+) Transcript_50849:168-1049(+)